jgi:inorganic pyrophosphatase
MCPQEGWCAAFNTAFRAGGVMGYSLCALSLMTLYSLCLLYREIFTTNGLIDYKMLFECVAGYGLGGSAIAMFGRVGGGIFTKAADVGADLSGKVIGVGDGKKLDEDSPYNPACIADNVGDNVGDVAGMGSDLFGSFGEASCAAMLIGSASVSIQNAGWSALVFPLFISAVGIVVCMFVSFVATDIQPVRCEADIEKALKIQLLLTSMAMTAALFPVTTWALPAEIAIPINGAMVMVSPMICYLCIVAGLWGGCLIGFITGTQFTCFTSTKVQTLTPEELLHHRVLHLALVHTRTRGCSRNRNGRRYQYHLRPRSRIPGIPIY